MGPPPPPGTLVPPRLRLPLLTAVLLGSLAFVLLCVDVAGKTTSTPLDHSLSDPPLPSWLLRYDVLKAAALLLPLATPAAAVGLAVACWRRGLRRAAVLAVAGPAVALAVTEGLKPLLARPSESDTGWMFPSGHVTAVTAVAAVGAVLLLSQGGRWQRRPTALLVSWAAVLGAPAATSLGTVVEHYHYPTDVLGGLLVAVVSVLTVAAALDTRSARIRQLDLR